MPGSKTQKWGMPLRPGIEAAAHAQLLWGAQTRATPQHHDFELDMNTQRFYVEAEVPAQARELITRALAVILESGGLLKGMRERVHFYRNPHFVQRKGQTRRTFRHGMKMLEQGKITPQVLKRRWADEVPATLTPGHRHLQLVHEDPSFLAYADTLGSPEHIHLLAFVRHQALDAPSKFALGDQVVHEIHGRCVVLGDAMGQIDGQDTPMHHVFLMHRPTKDARRALPVPQDSLEPFEPKGP